MSSGCLECLVHKHLLLLLVVGVLMTPACVLVAAVAAVVAVEARGVPPSDQLAAGTMTHPGVSRVSPLLLLLLLLLEACVPGGLQWRAWAGPEHLGVLNTSSSTACLQLLLLLLLLAVCNRCCRQPSSSLVAATTVLQPHAGAGRVQHVPRPRHVA
jgi:hypothetical protein